MAGKSNTTCDIMFTTERSGCGCGYIPTPRAKFTRSQCELVDISLVLQKVPSEGS